MVDGMAAFCMASAFFGVGEDFALTKLHFWFAWARVEVENMVPFFFWFPFALCIEYHSTGTEGGKGIPLLAVYYFAHLRTLLDVVFCLAVILSFF